MPFLGSWFKDEGDFGIPPTSKRKIDMDSLVWAGACEGNILDDFCRLPIITMIITIFQGTYHGDLKRLCYFCRHVHTPLHHVFFRGVGPQQASSIPTEDKGMGDGCHRRIRTLQCELWTTSTCFCQTTGRRDLGAAVAWSFTVVSEANINI